MRTRTIVAGIFGLALLSGCAAPPPPPPPTVINLTLNATADTNPTTDNAGAPIAMRAYQLTSAANFNGAEFFQIFNADAATLKTDIVKREEFEAVREMAIKARDENDVLLARIEALEAKLAAGPK